MIFFGMSCAATIYTNLDALMLGFMTTDVDVGYYNAAVKIKTILVSVVTALGAVLLPRFSYYVEHGQMDEFRRMARKALRFVLMFASALRRHRVPFEMHIYPHGHHGLGLAAEMPHVAQWAPSLLNWLGDIGFINNEE